MQTTIFVGGIHGVGKTTICKKLSLEFGLPHYSCSSLISKKQLLNKTTKAVANIGENQDILIEAITEFCSHETEIILDGHFCLRNKDGEVVEIPISTFESLSIRSIIILENDPKLIVENLCRRDSIQYEVDKIEQFQKYELVYSHKVANTLKVGHSVFNATTEQNNLEVYIQNLIKDFSIK